jgi:hypothetical protein
MQREESVTETAYGLLLLPGLLGAPTAAALPGLDPHAAVHVTVRRNAFRAYRAATAASAAPAWPALLDAAVRADGADPGDLLVDVATAANALALADVVRQYVHACAGPSIVWC